MANVLIRVPICDAKCRPTRVATGMRGCHESIALFTASNSVACPSCPPTILGGYWRFPWNRRGLLVPPGNPEKLARDIPAIPKESMSISARLEPSTLEYATV